MQIKNSKDLINVLQQVGWTKTRPRMVLLKTIFDGKDKHFSVQSMEQQLKDENCFFSHSTLADNLNHLATKKLINKIEYNRKYYFDTNLSDHIHVYDDEQDTIVDLDFYNKKTKDSLPVPACMELLKNYSIVIDLKKKFKS